MKPQNYILKIDNPCGQDWNSMTPNEKGNFCSHCSKTVIDFTNLTDLEVVNIVQQTNGKLCGRLTNNQQNRLLASPQATRSYRFSKILAGFMLFGVQKNSAAIKSPLFQTEISSTVGSEELVEQALDKKTKVVLDSLKNVVSGIVIDSATNEPLISARISIKGSKLNVLSDMDGKFTFVIPDSLLSESITFVILYVGFDNKEFVVRKNELPISKKAYHLQYSTDGFLVGEIVVFKKKKWWHRKAK